MLKPQVALFARKPPDGLVLVDLRPALRGFCLLPAGRGCPGMLGESWKHTKNYGKSPFFTGKLWKITVFSREDYGKSPFVWQNYDKSPFFMGKYRVLRDFHGT